MGLILVIANLGHFSQFTRSFTSVNRTQFSRAVGKRSNPDQPAVGALSQYLHSGAAGTSAEKGDWLNRLFTTINTGYH